MIAVCLSFIMATSLCVTSAGAAVMPTESERMAEELPANVAGSSVKKQLRVSEVAADLELLEEKYLKADDISLYGVTETGMAIYEQSIPGNGTAKAYLDTWTGEDGAAYVHVVEGDLENLICYTPDGKTYINGYDATNEVIGTDTGWISAGGEISPQAGGNLYSSFYSGAPNGTTASQYNRNYPSTYNSTSMVKFGDAIVKITVTVASAQIQAAAPGWYGLLGAAAFNMVVNTMINNMKSKCPDMKQTSFKDIRYPHPSNSTQCMMYLHEVTYYAGTNYTGSSYLGRTYYEVRQPT